MTSGFLRTWVRIPSTTDEEQCLESCSWKNEYLRIERSSSVREKKKINMDVAWDENDVSRFS
jgi:hypothetical protein